MQISNKACAMMAACTALTACAPSDAIDTDGAVFDGIAPTAQISLNGTEPFWSLEITPAPSAQGYTARFSSPSGDIPPEPFTMQRFAGNNGVGFNGALAGKPVQVAITPGECSDGMSEVVYPFAATIAWGDATLLGCGHTDAAPVIEAPAQ